MEEGHDGETISDIQNYLSSFNKEIQAGTHITHSDVAQVYVDEAGNYFYQTIEGQQQVVVVAEATDENNEVEEHTISNVPGDDGCDGTITTIITNSASNTSSGNIASIGTREVTLIGAEKSTVVGDVGKTVSFKGGKKSNNHVNTGLRGKLGGGMVVGQRGRINQAQILTKLEPQQQVVDATGDNEEALRSLAGAIARVEEHQVSVVDDGVLQVIPSIDPSSGGHNQVILNTGRNNQIVTIVPSSGNPGEMSYVLIVEQSDAIDEDDDDDTGKDHTVFDFTEAEDALVLSGDDEDDFQHVQAPIRLNRTLHRKPQNSAQAHMCNYCNYTSTKRYLLARHMRTHSEERPHKCSVCDRGFKTLPSLQNHLNTHTGVKPHRCKFCDTGFTTSGELVRHVRYIHTLEKPHKCSECDYCSVELSKLKRHMRCHTGERPYQCSHCTYASPDTFKLKRHLRIHTGEKPYECDICHARFTQSNSLKAHKLIHTGNKPIYTCELCPTTCGRKTDLRIHIQKLHTSEKPIKCKKCTKIFPDRYTFKLHNRTHDGEKCFKCDLCPYASTSSRHLGSHMLVHTEQKPYRCDLCEQSFRQKQLLRRHQNLYHNPSYIPPSPREKTQECPECGKSFRHKGNLIRHMAIHDPAASSQEKAAALKLGRQKRLQLINGQEVEVYTNDLGEEEELMAVEGQDGNQYVVLEVIQLQDDDGHHVMMGDELAALDGDGLGSSPLVGASHDSPMNSAIIDLHKSGPALLPEEIKKETKKEMDTCFGFDDEDETGQIHLQFGD